MSYIDEIQNATNKISKAWYGNFDFYLNLYGTTVIVERKQKSLEEEIFPNKEDIITEVYGKQNSLNTYETDEDNIKKSVIKLIINKTESLEFYNKQSEPLSCYLHKKRLDIGDKVTFKRNDIVYSFVVTEIKTNDDIIFEFRLQGLKEYTAS